MTPLGTASTRGSPQTELTKKMKFRLVRHLESRWTATSARGVRVMVEPEIGSEALKIDVAPLSVQVLNIVLGVYTIYLSFDAHSAII